MVRLLLASSSSLTIVVEPSRANERSERVEAKAMYFVYINKAFYISVGVNSFYSLACNT